MRNQQNQVGDLFDSVWDSAYSHFQNPTDEGAIELNKKTSLLRMKLKSFKL
ncbi:hypothetical protein [Flagellimonas okinawensis]|uniref:Uncharacterized protein n=1 Tax=Flagellimonas okinawensis TaxID=3031324 RepID=A0ABT5XL35_9FLAO|nr:hypothetical protein [[Muricauda] okinawensis]MDF0706600.1 hypothetical protein [[Muricauda] okinawensis]